MNNFMLLGKSVFAVLLVATVLSLTGCECCNKKGKKTTEDVKTKTNKKLNVFLFVDLSDHIDTATYKDMESKMYPYQMYGKYSEKIINSLRGFFQNEQAQNININIKVSGMPTLKQHDLTELYLDTTISNKYQNVDSFKKNSTLDSVVSSRIMKMAQMVLQEEGAKSNQGANNKDKWLGCNLFDFLDKGSFYDSTKGKNILILITDGYPYHEDNLNDEKTYFLQNQPNWKKKSVALNDSLFSQKLANGEIGLKKIDKNYKGLRVMLLGMRPDFNPKNKNEKKQLEMLWKNWLVQMGVKQDDIVINCFKNFSYSEVNDQFAKLLKD